MAKNDTRKQSEPRASLAHRSRKVRFAMCTSNSTPILSMILLTFGSFCTSAKVMDSSRSADTRLLLCSLHTVARAGGHKPFREGVERSIGEKREFYILWNQYALAFVGTHENLWRSGLPMSFFFNAGWSWSSLRL